MNEFITLRIFSDEYYLALGKFVSEFSELEQAMQISLWIISGVKQPLAQAVFSGVRADDAANKITRIVAAENWPEERAAEWQAICERLGLLRTFRNDILHYGVNWESEGRWTTTNRRFAHTPEKVSTSPVTVDILQAATEDVMALSLHLFKFVFNAKPDPLTALDRTRTDAWRYKSSRQAGYPRRSPDNAPKP
jgi:hypothetical protein